ncbi:hypothetical protein CHS0354_005417 [Potamilus streckersoni]|uniref:Protein CNPPD1 n=1 Tax=Potamilus streckersoni TaxID=2493646 RepID=A0AAE0T6J7_9BIVA|nr:hypothetical protein CHS0354_005417 [Potamilus streckersoni]
MMFFTNFSTSPGRRSLTQLEDHEEFSERLRKTLYFGKPPTTDRPSFPLTDIAVEVFQDVSPRKLGKLDMYFAASSSRNACMSPCSIMMGIIYANRLKKGNKDYAQKISSSELFLISMMMASKFMYDEGIDEEVFNDEWAAAGDLETEEINKLERDFLKAIDWQLFVPQQEFEEMLHLVEKRIAFQQGIKRGWFSYTDLWVLSQDINWSNVCRDIGFDLTQMLTVTSLAYFFGILTMVGSTVLGNTVATSLSTKILPLASNSAYQHPLIPLLPLPDFSFMTQVHPITAEVFKDNNLPNMSDDKIGAHNPTKIAATLSDLAGMGEVNKEPGTNSDRTENTFRNALALDKFLSHLLTLITIKNALIDFVYAVQEKQPVLKRKYSQQNRISDLLCSDGFCPTGTWSNCWNVTKEHPDLQEVMYMYQKQLSVENCNGNVMWDSGKGNGISRLGVHHGWCQCCCWVSSGQMIFNGLPNSDLIWNHQHGFITNSVPFVPVSA